MADVDPVRLRRSTLVVSPDQTVELDGTMMDGRLWDLDRNLHCPECSRLERLADQEAVSLGARRRVWWDCLAVEFCHEHRLRLEPSPSADEGPEESRRSSPMLADPTIDASWEAYLIGRLGFGLRLPSQLLDELNVVDALVSAALFGWVGLFGKASHFDKTKAFRDAAVFRRGFEILESESSLLAFLDERWLETGLHGARLTFKAVYGELHTYYLEGIKRPLGFCNEDHGPLRSRIVEHALSRLPLYPDPKIFRTIHTGRGLSRMPPASGKYYAWELPFFRIAVGLGLLDPAWANVEWRMIGIPAHVTEQVNAFRASTLTSQELGKMLGIGSKDLDRLVTSRQIVPVLRTDLMHFREAYFRKSVVATFLDRLTRMAPVVSDVPTSSVSFEEWRRQRRLSRIQGIEELLGGGISAIGRLAGVAGISGILLPPYS